MRSSLREEELTWEGSVATPLQLVTGKMARVSSPAGPPHPPPLSQNGLWWRAWPRASLHRLGFRTVQWKRGGHGAGSARRPRTGEIERSRGSRERFDSTLDLHARASLGPALECELGVRDARQLPSRSSEELVCDRARVSRSVVSHQASKAIEQVASLFSESISKGRHGTPQGGRHEKPSTMSYFGAVH
jgi:hypothetical protein